MSKNKNVLPSPIALISIAIVSVGMLGAGLIAKRTPVAPSNQISALDQMNVMHSDSYWSPFDKCPDAGLTDAIDCHKVQLPSLQSSLNRAEGMTTSSSMSRADLEKFPASSSKDQTSFNTLTNIAKSKHDASLNAIANTR